MKGQSVAAAAAAVATVGALLVGEILLHGAQAQPAPSFLAACADIRREIAKLDFRGDPLIVIQVAGKLREIRSGNPVLIALCDAPAPRVICVTYSSEGLVLDQEIVVSGSIARRSAALIVLDPCLHYPRERQLL